MDKTRKLDDVSGAHRKATFFFSTFFALLACVAVGFGLLLSGCGSTSNTPVVATATPVSTSSTATATAKAKAQAQASFNKFVADINNFNATIAKDNGSPQQQQLLLDMSGAALAGAVAVGGDGLNSGADVAVLAGAVKAVNDIAQLPSVQSTKSAQVKAAITAAAGSGNNATALASKAAVIFDAATAKGATPQSALLQISQGFTQAQSQAATAAAGAAPTGTP